MVLNPGSSSDSLRSSPPSFGCLRRRRWRPGEGAVRGFGSAGKIRADPRPSVSRPVQVRRRPMNCDSKLRRKTCFRAVSWAVLAPPLQERRCYSRRPALLPRSRFLLPHSDSRSPRPESKMSGGMAGEVGMGTVGVGIAAGAGMRTAGAGVTPGIGGAGAGIARSTGSTPAPYGVALDSPLGLSSLPLVTFGAPGLAEVAPMASTSPGGSRTDPATRRRHRERDLILPDGKTHAGRTPALAARSVHCGAHDGQARPHRRRRSDQGYRGSSVSERLRLIA